MTLYYKDKNLSNNVTIVGSPTVNGHVISGFSSSNYATTVFSSLTNNSFELGVKFTYNGATSGWQGIIKQPALSTGYGFVVAVNSENKLSLNLGNESWVGDVFGSTLVAGKTYWIKVIRETSTSPIYLYLSTDGVNYNLDITHNTDVSFENKTNVYLGNIQTASQPFNGSIDLSKCYAKINGNVQWTGLYYKLLKIRDYDTTGVYYGVGKSNCVLQLPNNINISLSNGIVTLKKGSKVYIPNGFEADGVTKKFDVYVVPEDITMGTVGTVTNNGDILYLDWNKNLQPYGRAYVYSGTTTPTTTYAYWYDENNNIIKYTSNGGTTWYSGHSLPIALINRTNGTVTAITQVFNGFGYIGSTFFTVPGIEMLIPDGFNPDKTYKSIKVVTNKVVTKTYTTTYSNCDMYINADNIYVMSSAHYDKNINYNVNSDGSYARTAQVAKASGSSGKISALTLNTVNPPNTVEPIGFVYQNGKLLYKGRHYEAWSVPSGALSKGYSATGEASSSIGNLFDKNHDTRWGQGVEGNRKWFRLTLPYPVIVDAITVIQGFAGSHDDSRIYNVTFYAELTGENSTGGQIQISNKQSLNWTVASSTAITITNKPICKRIYCWTEGQAYSTLGEVYISGRRVL